MGVSYDDGVAYDMYLCNLDILDSAYRVEEESIHQEESIQVQAHGNHSEVGGMEEVEEEGEMGFGDSRVQNSLFSLEIVFSSY